MKKERLSKKIWITPAWDKRNTDPGKNYGISSAIMYFQIKGSFGAIIAQISTGWVLPHNNKTMTAKLRKYYPSSGPVEFHHGEKSPLFDKVPSCEKCRIIKEKCSIRRVYSMGDEILSVLIEKGSDGVWEKLKEWYYKIIIQGEIEIADLTISETFGLISGGGER